MGDINAYFKYNADFGPVINQMRLLSTQANLLNQTLQNFDKQASNLKMSLGDALASDIGKMGGWNAKVIELSDSVGQFGKSLEKQELSLKQYAKEGIGAFTKSSNAHKLAVREVAREMSQLAILGEKNGKQMGMMITPTNINLNDLNTKLAVSRKQFDIFNTIVQDGATKLINFGKNTQWAGRQITVGLTVPIAGFAQQMMKAFREVNVELTRFQKVYGSGLMSSGDVETIKMTENVKQLGIEFSKTMGIAVKDTASLAADLAATGLEGQKLLNSLRETTRLATLGDVSSQDAMKTTLSLQNAFKISTDELSHSVDFLNAVENQTSLSLADLTTAIPKAGPVIKALGGDVKDLSLLMVALKEGGISAAEGANAVKSGMASLINPTKKASETAAQYGIDINKIVQANRGQLMPTIIEFQKQLQLLDDFGKAQVIENVFGKYQFARISALFDNLNASSSQTMQVMDLMGQSQRDLAANSYMEMDTLMNSGAKRFQRATESIKAQFIDIGGSITTAITPIIENVSSKIGKVIKFFDKLPAPIKSFIKVASGLAVIAGPVIMIAGVFSNFLGYITKGAMSIVNLGRRMSGIPVEKFKMLDDTQIMAQKSTDALSQAFSLQKTSVEQLNSVLAVYKKHLSDAITLNPGFVNQQVASQTTTGKPPVAKFQTGGSAWVPGSGDGDKVPAMLEPGEYVVNKKAASKHSGLLDEINYKQAPRFQTGGRINGYANKSFFGDAQFTPEDLQNALKSWISPMLTGLRPFNNPTKRGGIQPYGERYPGFFADIFNQSMSPQENKHFMRGMQYDRKGSNMSPVPEVIMDAIKMAQQGTITSPRLQWGNGPFEMRTTRFTSFSKVQETEFYKRFMSMFEKPKNKRSAESRARKIESGQIFPFIHDLWTGKGNGISGISVSDLFQGQTQYGNEGETVLPGGITMPITGYGSDLKTRMLMLHSVMPGATKNINGREVPIFQSGGRVNNYADKSFSPELLDLVRSWQESTTSIRKDPEKLKQLMSFFEASKDPMTLRRKTSLGLPGEIPNADQLAILQALESGDFLSIAGRQINFNGSPQSYSEHPFDWLVGKQFSNPLAGRDITQSSLIHWQRELQNFEILVQSYQNDPTNPSITPMLERSLTFKPGRKLPITQENIDNRRKELTDHIQSIQKELSDQLPMGVEPKKVLIERLFGKGTQMLPIADIADTIPYKGDRLLEKEVATSSTSGILDSVSQMWAPPSSFKGGKAMYDLQKNNFPYVLNMKQMGGRIQSAEVGLPEVNIKNLGSSAEGGNMHSSGISGYDTQSKSYYKQINNDDLAPKIHAMAIEAIFSQLYRTGIFGENVSGANMKLVNANFKKQNGIAIQSKKINNSVDPEELEDVFYGERKMRDTSAEKYAHLYIASLLSGNQDMHYYNFVKNGKKVYGIDTTSNLFSDIEGNIFNKIKKFDAADFILENTDGLSPAFDSYKENNPNGLKQYLSFLKKSTLNKQYYSQATSYALSGDQKLIADLNKYSQLISGNKTNNFENLILSAVSSRVAPVSQYLLSKNKEFDKNLRAQGYKKAHKERLKKVKGTGKKEESFFDVNQLQTGGRVNNFDSKTWGSDIYTDNWYARKDGRFLTREEEINMTDPSYLQDKWTDYDGMRGIRSNPKQYNALWNSVHQPIKPGILMSRGTVLNSKSPEFISSQASQMIAAIKSGNINSLVGQKLNLRGMLSFSSDPNNKRYPVSRFLINSAGKANVVDWDKYKAGDPTERLKYSLNKKNGIKVGNEGVENLVIDFLSGKSTTGKNLHENSPLAGEFILTSPSGIITSASKTEGTRSSNPFTRLDVQGLQSGGRVNNFADSSIFMHFVPPTRQGYIRTTLPLGIDIPGNSNINSLLNQPGAKVSKNRLYNAVKTGKVNEMSKEFKLSGINPSFAEQVKAELLEKIQNSKKYEMFNDSRFYDVAGWNNKTGIIGNVYRQLIESGRIRDYRPDISPDSLVREGYRNNGDGTFTKGNLTVRKNKGYWEDVSTGENLIKSTGSTPQSSLPKDGTRGKFLRDFMRPTKASREHLGMQSGGRINNYAEDSMITRPHSWKKKASAPKQYEQVLRNLPDWATRGAEAQAILAALQAAGIPNPDEKAGYYIQNVLAHLNPATTNDGEIYTKIWEAINLMKDSQVYNTFLETIQSRRDIQSRGGLVAPHVVKAVMADSGLPQGLVIEELTKLSQGKHPNTRQGAMTMLALARIFPQTAKGGRGIPIGVIAGLQERLKGDFYETIQSRELPAGLPTVKVTSVKPGEGNSQSRKSGSLPGAPTMPKIVYPSMEGGGSRMSGTGATVNVSPDGKILSNTIDDMLVQSASGHTIAVSSRELLAVTPEGTIAGVTSPGDEARKKIIHPFGTSLIRGKNFRAKSAAGGTEPVYMGPMQGGSMANFAASLTSMVGVVGQLQFAFETFTSEVANGTQKWVAGIELATSSLQLFADNGMGSLGEKLKEKGFERQGLKQKLDPKTLEPMLDADGNPVMVKSKTLQPKLGGKLMSGIGSAMSKVASGLSNPLVQIGLQLGMAAINKSIQIYNAEMEKAKVAGNGAFKEPTETAKLLGVQLKSLTDSAEKYAKANKAINGEQGRGAYDKAFEKTIKADYGDFIGALKDTQTEQEKVNQLTNAYTSLIQRGMDPKNAKEMTAEIARQAGTLSAYNKASSSLGKIKDSKGAMSAQLETMTSQIDILEKRRKMVTSGTGTDLGQGLLGAVTGGLGSYVGGRSEGQELRADTVNKAIFGGNQDKWWAKALTGTGIDRNPFVQVLGGWLADKKLKQQVASQLGATLKDAFAMAADNPSASSEAIRAIVQQFKNADWGTLSKEIKDILKEKGFGDSSELTKFMTSETIDYTNTVVDSAKEGNDLLQQQLFEIINVGRGTDLEKLLKNGKLNPNSKEFKKLIGEVAQTKALVKIEAEVDLQLEDTRKQLDGLKDAVQKVFEAAIEAKQKELEAEDKRHEAALDNLDKEAEKIGKKKDLLQENTDYYLKELQREKDAEDYYANQRNTALGGLKSLSSGDVFGFIGAQQQAASQADQFGRDQSLKTIQDTADEEQKKLDNALKGIDDRKKAEDARHQAEMDNINAEILALRKKESQSVGQINEALSLIEKAEKMTAGDKGFDKAVRTANNAARQAGITARVNTEGLKIAAGTDKDIAKAFNTARGDLKDALDIMAGDTVSAVTILNNKGRIASNVFKSMGIDPKTSKEYQDVFKILQRPLDPKTKDAIELFMYAKPEWATDDKGKDITITATPTTQTRMVNPGNPYQVFALPGTEPKTKVTKKGFYTVDGKNVWLWNGSSWSASSPLALGMSTKLAKADGGAIYGAGTATSDSIPAMLSNGEFVVKASSVAKYGVPFMNAINAGRYAGGGGVGVMPRTSVPSSPTYSVPSTPSVSPASIAGLASGGAMGDMSNNNPTYHFNFNGAGMDMVMGHVNKAMGGTINNNSRGVYC